MATQLDALQKYAGAEAAKTPKLNKLGGQEWHKTKSKVRGAVRSIARELVELYAVRQEKEGYVCGPDTVWQKEFEEMFPYEETEDQLAAIEDAKRDMESKKLWTVWSAATWAMERRRLLFAQHLRLSRRAARWRIWYPRRFWHSSIIIPLCRG